MVRKHEYDKVVKAAEEVGICPFCAVSLVAISQEAQYIWVDLIKNYGIDKLLDFQKKLGGSGEFLDSKEETEKFYDLLKGVCKKIEKEVKKDAVEVA